MCEIFAGQNCSNYESETRSMRIDGHVTSIRLERMFWLALEDLAAAQGIALPRFVSTLYDEVLDLHGNVKNFASLLRCSCLIHVASRDTVTRAAKVDRAEKRPIAAVAEHQTA